MINKLNRTVSYRVLELEGSALEEEIKKAYRRLAKKYHPDRNPDDPEAWERFKEIHQAYDFLINEETHYDQCTENQWDNQSYSAMQDNSMQSLREMAVKYYADRGWFKNGDRVKFTEEGSTVSTAG